MSDAILGTNGKSFRSRLKKQAICYLERGWSIFPIKEKKRPLFRWTRLQTERLTLREAEWCFSDSRVEGIAVIFGEVSGGICERDFDTQYEYNRWVELFPQWQMLPTVKTYRGCRVLFRGPFVFHKIKSLWGGHLGEYRGTVGHYSVFPESRHPSGTIYEWLHPLPGSNEEIPALDPYVEGLVSPELEGTYKGKRSSGGGVQPIKKDAVPSSLSSNGLVVHPGKKDASRDPIERAIASTQPDVEGERNQKIFALCRKLKVLPSLGSKSADDPSLLSIISDWHRRALPFIGTKDFAETLADFRHAWDNVQMDKAYGSHLRMLFDEAQEEPLPKPFVEKFREGSRKMKLAKLCRLLQRLSGEEPFYLGCIPAGEVLGISFALANKWLRMFCDMGLLKLVNPGSQAKKRANEYLCLIDASP